MVLELIRRHFRQGLRILTVLISVNFSAKICTDMDWKRKLSIFDSATVHCVLIIWELDFFFIIKKEEESSER